MDPLRHQAAPDDDGGIQDEDGEAVVDTTTERSDPQYPTQGGSAPDTATAGREDEVTSSILDCPVCLQPSVHPVELPCGHIFCFLCIKGVATQGGQQARCAICRAHIPTHVLTNPTLKDISQLYKDDKTCSGFKWFYESRSGGWWQYEERTMQELEKAFEAKQPSCQLLIAGHMYDIDFTQMIQFRVGNRNLFRRIKRDTSTTDKRGIAGIRLVQDVPPSQTVQPPQQPSSRRRASRGTASSSSGSSARTAGVNMVGLPGLSVQSEIPCSISPNDLSGNFVTSPVSSQQSFEDSEEDSDVFVDSDDDEEVEDENDDDMDLGEEEEDSETDEYNPEEEDLRDGARAPTSRSDRSTSSFNNQTPPPLSSSAVAAAVASSSTRGRASKCGNRSTPPTSGSRSTPSSSSSTSNNSDHVNASPSPVSPTLRVSPNVRSPLPSIVTTCSNSSNVSTSIQIGPGLRITVDYTNPTGEEEIL